MRVLFLAIAVLISNKFVAANDLKPSLIHASLKVQQTGRAGSLCKKILQSLGLTPSRGFEDAKIWMTGMEFASAASELDERESYDLIGANLSDEISETFARGLDPAAPIYFSGLEGLRFSVRKKAKNPSLIVEVGLIARRQWIAESWLARDPSHSYQQRPPHWVWNWSVSLPFKFHPALLRADDRSAFVKAVDASDVRKKLGSARFDEMNRFDFYREILGLPYSEYGRYLDAGNVNDQLSFELFDGDDNPQRGKWFLVFDPERGAAAPIGWARQIDYTIIWRERSHETREQRRYFAHYGLDGRRIEVLISRDPSELPGRLIKKRSEQR